MSERREIKVYRPRITIPLENMFDSAGQYALYCLPVDMAEALAWLLPYLEREVTYVYEPLDDKYYLGPLGVEMASILDMVAETEELIMSPCDFSTIVDAIGSLTASVTALQCVCDTLASQAIPEAWGGDLQSEIEAGRLYPGYELPTLDIPSQGAVDACGIAQLYWAWMFETMTEYFLPAWRTTFDDIIPVVFAAIAGFTTGGAAAIPAWGFAELLQELIEIGYDSAEADLLNWMYGVKEDWVCLAYDMLKEGSTDKAIAAAVKSNIIDVADDISFGDRTIVAFFGGPWSLRNGRQAWIDQTAWAVQNTEAGYCDACEPLAEGCVSLEPCTLAHWAGNVECHNGLATVMGGTAWNTEYPLPWPTAPGYLHIVWTPYTAGAPSTATVRVYARRVSDGYLAVNQVTPAKPTGVRTTDTFSLGASAPGVMWQIALKQESNNCGIHYWCMNNSPTPPE